MYLIWIGLYPCLQLIQSNPRSRLFLRTGKIGELAPQLHKLYLYHEWGRFFNRSNNLQNSWQVFPCPQFSSHEFGGVNVRFKSQNSARFSWKFVLQSIPSFVRKDKGNENNSAEIMLWLGSDEAVAVGWWERGFRDMGYIYTNWTYVTHAQTILRRIEASSIRMHTLGINLVESHLSSQYISNHIWLDWSALSQLCNGM